MGLFIGLSIPDESVYGDMPNDEKKPCIVDVTTVDLHKDEKPLKKTSRETVVFYVGMLIGCIITSISFLYVLLIR